MDPIAQGTWPVQIVNALPNNEGGYHQTYLNQPYSKVINTPGSDEWPSTPATRPSRC
jgi:hypothetical protein